MTNKLQLSFVVTAIFLYVLTVQKSSMLLTNLGSSWSVSPNFKARFTHTFACLFMVVSVGAISLFIAPWFFSQTEPSELLIVGSIFISYAYAVAVLFKALFFARIEIA